MKPKYQTLNNAFRGGPIADCLRYLAPTERFALGREAFCDYTDEDTGHEPTVKISVRIPVSLAIRLDLERANVKRALRRRRATRSDTVRHLIEQHLAEQDKRAAESAAVCGPLMDGSAADGRETLRVAAAA